jgi:hypothetical protein
LKILKKSWFRQIEKKKRQALQSRKRRKKEFFDMMVYTKRRDRFLSEMIFDLFA